MPIAVILYGFSYLSITQYGQNRKMINQWRTIIRNPPGVPKLPQEYRKPWEHSRKISPVYLNKKQPTPAHPVSTVFFQVEYISTFIILIGYQSELFNYVPGENQKSSSFTWKISCDSATAPPTNIAIPRTKEIIPLPVIPNMKLE